VPLPRNFFCPQNDNFYAVFNRQKPWNMDFTVRSQNEAYKNSTKIIQKFTVKPKGREGAVAQSLSLNTPLAPVVTLLYLVQRHGLLYFFLANVMDAVL